MAAMDIEVPPTAPDMALEKYEALLSKFQRDINRTQDPDRSTRRRGIQKLLDDLPWTGKVVTFKNLGYSLISDPVEKCRELSLHLLKKVFENITGLKIAVCCAILSALASRVSSNPFSEAAEELRLQVTEILCLGVEYTHKAHLKDERPYVRGLLDDLLLAATRALQDSFPSVKRTCASLLVELARIAPTPVRRNYRKICIGLSSNCSHQHSKTRNISLQAMGSVLCLVKDGFDTALGSIESENTAALDKQTIMSVAAGSAINSDDLRTGTGTGTMGGNEKSLGLLLLFSKLMLSMQLGAMLGHRFSRYQGPVSSHAELQALVLLLLLIGDEIDDVAAAAMGAIENCTSLWTGSSTSALANEDGDIVDGEAELAKAKQMASSLKYADDGATTKSHKSRRFMVCHASQLAPHLLRGVADWTAVGQRRYLLALNKFLLIGGTDATVTILPSLFNALGSPCRDDDAHTRNAAEECCSRIGSILGSGDGVSDAIDLLIPRVKGIAEGGGGNTSSYRSNAIRVLTHILKGLLYAVDDTTPSNTKDDRIDTVNATAVIESLSQPELYEFREPFFREAVLLLVRSILETFAEAAVNDTLLERHVVKAFIYLQGKVSGEADIVPAAAKSEMESFAKLAYSLKNPDKEVPIVGKAIADLFARHFTALLDSIYRASLEAQGSPPESDIAQISWPHDSVSKSAFDMLIRSAPSQAWAIHEKILPVIVPQVKLPPITPQDTPEAHMETYKAQAGDTDAYADKNNANTRLTLMALLESWVRSGASDWTCSANLSAAASILLKNIIIINLVWRVGRVEATVRKVTLAVAYSLLRAGAVKPVTLYEVASELTPQIVSQLDDHETSMRHMAALCLCVIFERLKGAFGYQAVSELYPMLVKRLDDSNDDVRMQSCKALGAFMASSSPGAFSGTALDYTLDQLFIHLDDPDAEMQAVVYDVIIIGSSLNKDLVWKKAHESLATHRNTKMCDKLIAELRG
eukprot:GSChrysophyteH1.ASY1.ANO1.1769.1 assembled CDS